MYELLLLPPPLWWGHSTGLLSTGYGESTGYSTLLSTNYDYCVGNRKSTHSSQYSSPKRTALAGAGGEEHVRESEPF